MKQQPTKGNPFLKKASGPKPATRREMKHGLGRGLGSLIDPGLTAPIEPAVAPISASQPMREVAPSKDIIEVKILDIERSPWQPRSEFKEEDLRELAYSIKANGIIQLPLVRHRADGKLELMAGERRLRAAQLAGLDRVRVQVREANDRTAAEIAVTENAMRQDLNPIDEAEGYHTLREKFDLTQEQISERIGKSRSAIANSLRLLELPDTVQDLLRSKALSIGHAKVLLSVKDQDRVRALALECVPYPDARTGRLVGGMTVRELERKVARMNDPVVEKKPGVPDISDSYVRTLTDAMNHHFGCAVRLTSAMTHANGRRSKGRIEIDYIDNDDLDRLLSVLGVKVD